MHLAGVVDFAAVLQLDLSWLDRGASGGAPSRTQLAIQEPEAGLAPQLSETRQRLVP